MQAGPLYAQGSTAGHGAWGGALGAEGSTAGVEAREGGGVCSEHMGHTQL